MYIPSAHVAQLGAFVILYIMQNLNVGLQVLLRPALLKAQALQL